MAWRLPPPSSPLPSSVHARSIAGILSPDRVDVVHHIRIEFGRIPAPIDLEASGGLKVKQIGVDAVDALAHQAAHFCIGNARRLVPGDLTVRRYHLDVRVVTGCRSWIG